MYSHENMPTRTLSSDSTTLHSISQYDQMDSEVRTQIQSNIHALYEPSVAPLMHIATCHGRDGAYLAFLVKQDNLAKAISDPGSLASEPKPTRSAAMLSLLEATEQRIADLLIRNNSMREPTKKNPPEPKEIQMQTEKIAIDYGEKPKEKGFMLWRKQNRV